jgi:hypothetical protein
LPGIRVYPEIIEAGLALAEQSLLNSGLSAEQTDEPINRLRIALQPPEVQTPFNVYEPKIKSHELPRIFPPIIAFFQPCFHQHRFIKHFDHH